MKALIRLAILAGVLVALIAPSDADTLASPAPTGPRPFLYSGHAADDPRQLGIGEFTLREDGFELLVSQTDANGQDAADLLVYGQPGDLIVVNDGENPTCSSTYRLTDFPRIYDPDPSGRLPAFVCRVAPIITADAPCAYTIWRVYDLSFRPAERVAPVPTTKPPATKPIDTFTSPVSSPLPAPTVADWPTDLIWWRDADTPCRVFTDGTRYTRVEC